MKKSDLLKELKQDLIEKIFEKLSCNRIIRHADDKEKEHISTLLNIALDSMIIRIEMEELKQDIVSFIDVNEITTVEELRKKFNSLSNEDKK